jgi:hypothetical protein
MQQKQISSAPNYPYHAYFYNALNYGSDAVTSQLQLQLFYKDSAGAFDTTRLHPQGQPYNGGAQARMEYSRGSKIIELEGPIFTSVCNCDKYILNGVEIKIKLQQSRDQFRLMANTDELYRVEITNVFLKVCKVCVTPAIIAGHDLALSKSNAIYNFTKTEIKSYTIAQGAFNYTSEDFFNGDIPSRLFVAFISSAGFNGDYKLSPYNFKHYHASSLSVTVDGQIVPTKALQPVYVDRAGELAIPIVDGNYTDAYQTILSGLDKLGRDKGLIFNKAEFALGYCIYLFDLDGAISGDGDFPLIRKGNIKFDCRFEKETPETINVLLVGEFGSVFEIDQTRNILLS